MASAALAFLAGLLSILSPCVLPLLPIVVGAAVTEHRFGALALSAGLAVSFTLLGLFLALAGFALGLDANVLRYLAAAIIIVVGSVLVVPEWQMRIATAGAPASAWADRTFGGFNASGLPGQFALGLLLGAVWSPCVGPTLGAASILASQGRDLGHVVLTMAVFGLGAALPLVILGSMSRRVLFPMRDRLLSAGKVGKTVLGAALILIAIGILSGLDKKVETALIDFSPAWLTDLTTRF